MLYAVAAAVIGGASLFGGHGKAIHPVLGGLVIATLTNGLALLNISTAGTDIATAAVSCWLPSRWTPPCGAEASPGRSDTGRAPLLATAGPGEARNPSPPSCSASFALSGPCRRLPGLGRHDLTTTRPQRHWSGRPRGPCTTAASWDAASLPSVTSVDLSSRAWTSPALDGQLYTEPLVLGGRVFVATENDTVYALTT